ncbi:signal peptidase II [Leucobacter triazinivorans]|uniref:Lipoprotein signal peptidase n=1 Tax=Leucobacter triazinivorans TaxID=1784719 RepID=A0A4P6KHU8_9MICO|nr:signal peptidase II [Leucobacter triazinivorans]QBE49568.1 lipoprotein signal peptidase [Leucobacter triazinivorans]
MTHELPQDPPVDEGARPAARPTGRRPARRLLFAYSCAIAALTIAIDVISKQLALHSLDTETRIPLLGDLLGLQLAFNTGAAFSIGSQLTPFITLLGIVASVLLVRAALRTKRRIYAAAVGLILGGAIGNLVDRIFAPPGFGSGAVTDFLAYGELFIGNLADVAIGAGIVLYLFGAWRIRASSRTSPATADGSAAATAPEEPNPDTATARLERTHP